MTERTGGDATDAAKDVHTPLVCNRAGLPRLSPVEVIEITGWYDGPLAGTCTHEGETYTFEVCDGPSRACWHLIVYKAERDERVAIGWFQ